jgi:hypothetical protein
MKILGIVGSNRKKGNSYLLFKCNINQLLLFNCVQRPIVTFDSNLFACFDKEIFGKDVKNETEFRTGVRLHNFTKKCEVVKPDPESSPNLLLAIYCGGVDITCDKM